MYFYMIGDIECTIHIHFWSLDPENVYLRHDKKIPITNINAQEKKRCPSHQLFPGLILFDSVLAC